MALLAMPPEVKAQLRDALANCRAAEDNLHFAMVFVTTQAELRKHFQRVAQRLAPAGMLWISWPKKTSGVASDLDENAVRKIGLKAGLVDVKVCAVSEVWSGLKFVRRVKDREPLPSQH